LYQDEDGRLSILDGQHRVGMMTVLLEKNVSDQLNLHQVLVEVYPHQPDKDLASELFVEINKAEPVKLVDMPGVAKKGDRKVITDAVARIQATFPDMFKPSQSCRSPHLNMDNVRDALFAADVLRKHAFKSTKSLEAWILSHNEALKEKYESNEELRAQLPTAAWAKADKYGFYLGLESGWYYQ
jgi:hypothetical protein